MAYVRSFGCSLPPRVVTNQELAARLGCAADWIENVSGIRERRYAEPDQTIADLAVPAAEDCLARAGVNRSEIGMVIVSSGTGSQRFPGPAAAVAHRLELTNLPALDLPMPSSGSLFGIALANTLAPFYRNILVIAAEKMSSVTQTPGTDSNVAILFGDGAGACLISSQTGRAEIDDCLLHSDGSYSEDLCLELNGVLKMKGRSVILQASRKLPRAIEDVLHRNGRTAGEVDAFLVHQANQNLTSRIALALQVPEEKFFSNIARYGNTSSASMLIAAAEWDAQVGLRPGTNCVFAAFGAGFHWGAVLARGV